MGIAQNGFMNAFMQGNPNYQPKPTQSPTWGGQVSPPQVNLPGGYQDKGPLTQPSQGGSWTNPITGVTTPNGPGATNPWDKPGADISIGHNDPGFWGPRPPGSHPGWDQWQGMPPQGQNAIGQSPPWMEQLFGQINPSGGGKPGGAPQQFNPGTGVGSQYGAKFGQQGGQFGGGGTGPYNPGPNPGGFRPGAQNIGSWLGGGTARPSPSGGKPGGPPKGFGQLGGPGPDPNYRPGY